MSLNGGMDTEMWYIYTVEYYSAIQNNEFMKCLGKWLKLENIIPSEVTQSQKNTHGMQSDKWILISPEALNTQGTISITNDSHEEVRRVP